MSVRAKHVQQGGDGDGEQGNIARTILHSLMNNRVVHQVLAQPSCMLLHHEAHRLSS
jgi:hypothetical protein